MPERRRRSSLTRNGLGWRAVATVLVALVSLLPALGSVSAAPLRPMDIAQLGIDEKQLTDDLADDHVAALSPRTDKARLAAVVADARNKGFELSVITTAKAIPPADINIIATEAQRIAGGTVLVLSQSGVGLYSAEMSGSAQQDAMKAATGAGSDDVLATQKVVEAAVPKGFPWLIVIIAAAVVFGGIILFSMLRRRRQEKVDEAAVTELSRNLGDRLGKLAPLIIGMPARVDVANRPDLSERFNQASGDYAQLKEKVPTLQTRAELDETTAQVADLEKRVGALDGELDVLLPGLEPPIG